MTRQSEIERDKAVVHASYQAGIMFNHTHETAPTQFVQANGIRFAYRRFGRAGGAPRRSSSTSTSPARWTIGTRR
jgi:hypothetical protein